MQAIAGYTSATHKPIKFCTQKRIVCPTRFDTLNTYVDRYIQCVIHKNGIKHDIVREALENPSLLGISRKYWGGGGVQNFQNVLPSRNVCMQLCASTAKFYIGANATIILLSFSYLKQHFCLFQADNSLSGTLLKPVNHILKGDHGDLSIKNHWEQTAEQRLFPPQIFSALEVPH